VCGFTTYTALMHIWTNWVAYFFSCSSGLCGSYHVSTLYVLLICGMDS